LEFHLYDLFSENNAPEKDLDHVLYRINYDINTKLAQKKHRFHRVITFPLKIAGVIIFSSTVFWGIKGYKDHSIAKETRIEIKAPAWTRAQFSLPDGTTGWLNSNSSISYKGTFNSSRVVNLTGEAFFNVIKNENKPFKVLTNEVEVKVLGTQFNIASYENEKNVEVVLEEGKLEFKGKGVPDTRLMKPNDLIVYDKASKSISAEVTQPEKYVSWKEGKLVFRNDPMDVIARRLERWYNVEVEISGKLPDDFRLRATFVDESLEEVLYFLGRSLRINYRIESSRLKPDNTYAKKKVIINSR
jgi:ferric-dicitrate binding protein FerR (iron transport regulator)